jgi:hypothetical protein
MQQDKTLRTNLTGAPSVRILDLTRVDEVPAELSRSAAFPLPNKEGRWKGQEVEGAAAASSPPPNARASMEATLVYGGGSSSVLNQSAEPQEREAEDGVWARGRAEARFVRRLSSREFSCICLTLTAHVMFRLLPQTPPAGSETIMRARTRKSWRQLQVAVVVALATKMIVTHL